MLVIVLCAALLPQILPQWRAATCTTRIERLRQELAGVQMELMDVMHTDRGSAEWLKGREKALKYALRAEEIRLFEAARCQDSKPRDSKQLLPSEIARCEKIAETPQS